MRGNPFLYAVFARHKRRVFLSGGGESDAWRFPCAPAIGAYTGACSFAWRINARNSCSGSGLEK